MATLTSQIQALIDYVNETTGAGDTLLGDAVRTLVEGYGQGGGEYNPAEDGYVWAYYDITTTSEETALLDNAGSIRNFEIDGTPMSVVKKYQFDTLGEHLLRFQPTGTSTNTWWNGITALKRVYLPESIVTIYDQCFRGTTNLLFVKPLGKITRLNSFAFNNAFMPGSCAELSFPNLTYVGSRVFTSSKIKDILNLGSTLTSIQSYNSEQQFNGSTVERVVFPESFTTIRDCFFMGCRKLREVILPESIQKISWRAFQGCPNLRGDFYLPNCTEIGLGSFRNAGRITISKLGDGCKIISDNSDGTFVNGTQVSYVNFDGVVSVGTSAFRDNNHLQSIGDASRLETIGQRAFSRCTSLGIGEILNLPSLKEIASGAFSATKFIGVKSLGEIERLNGNQTEDQGTFGRMDNLKYVFLPPTIQSLNQDEFRWDVALHTILVEALNPPTINSITFRDCSTNLKFYVPAASKADYAAADVWSGLASRLIGYEEVTALPSNPTAEAYLVNGVLWRNNEGTLERLDFDSGDWI